MAWTLRPQFAPWDGHGGKNIGELNPGRDTSLLEVACACASIPGSSAGSGHALHWASSAQFL